MMAMQEQLLRGVATKPDNYSFSLSPSVIGYKILRTICLLALLLTFIPLHAKVIFSDSFEDLDPIFPPPLPCIDDFTPSTAGTEYFVAPNGDDNNAGSSAAPFRSVRKGLSVLQPGDTLTLREGTYRLPAEPDYPVHIGEGNENAFVTLQAEDGANVRLLGSLSTGGRTWEQYNDHIWRLSAAFLQRDPKGMFNGERRIRHQSDLQGGRDHDDVQNLTEPDSWTKAHADGSQCFASNENCYIYLYPRAGENPNDEIYELSQRDLGRFWSDYMVVRKLRFDYTQPQPIFFEGANNIRLEGNTFAHTSNGNDNSYAVRIWSSGGALVRGNIVYDSVYWGGVSNSKGISFMLSDPDNPHIVEFNEVYDIPGHAAIGVKGGVSNLIVRYNYIHDVYVAFEPGDFRCVWTKPDCGPGDPEYRPAGAWRIYGNIVVRANTGLELQGWVEDTSGNTVYNNVFYDSETGIKLGWNGSFGHVFANNAFVSNRVGIYLHSGGTTTTVEDYLDQYSARNNLYFDNELADIHLRPNWGGGYDSGTSYTLQEFQSNFSGTEQQSISADPLFVDPVINDFHLRDGSPAAGAGSAEFYQQGQVDIGAYPFGKWSCSFE